MYLPTHKNIFIGASVFIVAFILLIIFFSNQKNSIVENTSTQNTNTNAPIIDHQPKTYNRPSTEVLRSWKTYTNTTYGYKFSYPSDWEISPIVADLDNSQVTTEYLSTISGLEIRPKRGSSGETNQSILVQAFSDAILGDGTNLETVSINNFESYYKPDSKTYNFVSPRVQGIVIEIIAVELVSSNQKTNEIKKQILSTFELQ